MSSAAGRCMVYILMLIIQPSSCNFSDGTNMGAVSKSIYHLCQFPPDELKAQILSLIPHGHISTSLVFYVSHGCYAPALCSRATAVRTEKGTAFLTSSSASFRVQKTIGLNFASPLWHEYELSSTWLTFDFQLITLFGKVVET